MYLASGDGFVAHGGLPTVWLEPLGTSPDQCAAARGQHDAALSVSVGSYRSALAERIGGGAIWVAPAACGIGGLGVRTEGCAQRVLRTTFLNRLRPLRAEAEGSNQ